MAASMRTLSLRNWDKHQHYRDRRPPWVKFYVDFLDDPQLFDLKPTSRLAAALLILLAGLKDNKIPDSAQWLAAECNISVVDARRALADLLAARFLIPASEFASTDASESDSTDASSSHALTGTREEAETEKEEISRAKALSPELQLMRRVLSYANQTLGHRWKLTETRKSKIRARLREGYTEQQLVAAIDGALLDPWEFRTINNNDDPVILFRDATHVDRFLAFASPDTNGHDPAAKRDLEERLRAERIEANQREKGWIE